MLVLGVLVHTMYKSSRLGTACLDLNSGLKRGIAAEALHAFRMAVVLLKGKGIDGLGLSSCMLYY